MVVLVEKLPLMFSAIVLAGSLIIGDSLLVQRYWEPGWLESRSLSWKKKVSPSGDEGESCTNGENENEITHSHWSLWWMEWNRHADQAVEEEEGDEEDDKEQVEDEEAKEENADVLNQTTTLPREVSMNGASPVVCEQLSYAPATIPLGRQPQARSTMRTLYLAKAESQESCSADAIAEWLRSACNISIADAYAYSEALVGIGIDRFEEIVHMSADDFPDTIKQKKMHVRKIMTAAQNEAAKAQEQPTPADILRELSRSTCGFDQRLKRIEQSVGHPARGEGENTRAAARQVPFALGTAIPDGEAAINEAACAPTQDTVVVPGSTDSLLRTAAQDASAIVVDSCPPLLLS